MFSCIMIGFLILSLCTILYPKNIRYLICIAFILEFISFAFQNPIYLDLNDIYIYPKDLIILVMIILVFLISIRKIKIKINVLYILLFIIFIMLFQSFFRGILTKNFDSNFIGDIRKFFQFLIPIIYFSYNSDIFYRKDTKKLINLTMNLTLIFCLLYWFANIILGFKLGPEGSLRVVSSNTALMIALYALICIYNDLYIEKKAFISIRTIIFIMSILILQHNSVWMAFFTGLIFMILFFDQRSKKSNLGLIFSIVIIIILGTAILTFFSDSIIVQNLLNSFNKFNDVKNSTGTFGTRLEVWKTLINTLNIKEWFIGKPLGSGYEFMYRGIPWTASPHSAYIESIMRIGTIGTVSLVMFMFFAIKKLFGAKKYLYIAIMLSILVYWIPYSFTLESGCIIGIIINSINNNSKF